MSAIIHVPGVRLSISVPAPTPASGLLKCLGIIRSALDAFPATPGAEHLGAALCGFAWAAEGSLVRLLPSPSPQPRTTHLITIGLDGTPMISIATVIFDAEDETFGQIHEGTFVARDILRDLPQIVKALT